MPEEQKIPSKSMKKAEWTQGTAPPARLMGASEEDGPKTGTVIAGAALVWTVLKDLLAVMSQPRRIAIAINNYPPLPLTEPRFVCCGGGLETADLEIPGKVAGFVSAQKTFADGTFGVVSYQIGESKDRLAVMWSVPENRIFYKNWFKLAIIPNDTPTDSRLFDDMYYNKGKLTKGDAAKADDGSAKWSTERYKLSAVMGTTEITTLNTAIKLA